MFFKKTNKHVSEKKLQRWVAKQKLELVVALLKTGNVHTKLKVIEILAKINLANVKKALVEALDDKTQEVALLAAEKLEYMGVTNDEKELVTKCRKKWDASK